MMDEVRDFFRDESRHPSEWMPAVAKGCPLPECDFRVTVQWKKRATGEIVDVRPELLEMIAREHYGQHGQEDLLRIEEILKERGR